jgi:cellulose synthase/poly-beta-1,6-N-acetylglucosamine synthase-like glycosyltransferase
MSLFLIIRTLITTIFLLSIVSYYVLFFVKKAKPKHMHTFSKLTVIVPAHNEEEYIEDCIKSILTAEFNGKKEIIIIDDGSKDNTFKIAKKYESESVKVFKTDHSGKSAALNLGLKHAKGELFAIVDADSIIEKNALQELVIELGRENMAAACGVVKVKNRHKFLCLWPHIEMLYNSLIRSIFSKINANVVTPGALSMYRTDYLREIGGFCIDGFSEDTDITIRLIRKGHSVGFAEKAISETNMPYDIKGFLRQRTRFARGLINLLKKHLSVNKTVIDIYTLPLFLFSYLQSVIMGSFIVYQIISGYATYFVSQGVYFNVSVLKFFFEWFSIVGFAKWFWSAVIGATPLTLITLFGIISTFLSYPLYFISIFRYDKKINLLHIIPIFFMFPFWFILMIIYTLCLPEYFRKRQKNIWKKNE